MTNKITKFIILAAARTGSTYLVTSLASHPQICCYSEIFNPYIKDYERALAEAGLPYEEDVCPQTLLEKLFARYEKDENIRFVGFKLLMLQSRRARKYVLGNPDYKIIVLEREDKLAQYSSFKLVDRTGRWAAYDKKDIKEDKIDFSFVGFMKFRRRQQELYARTYKEIKDTGRPFLRVTYEDMTRGGGLRKVLEYLGVEDKDYPLTSPLFRQNSPHILRRFNHPWKAAIAYLPFPVLARVVEPLHRRLRG